MFFNQTPLWVIRHGQCDRDPSTQKYHHSDISLNLLGKQEVDREADEAWVKCVYPWLWEFFFVKKKEENVKILFLYSPYRRVEETAKRYQIRWMEYLQKEGWMCRVTFLLQKEDRLSNQQGPPDKFFHSLQSLFHQRRQPQDQDGMYQIWFTHGRVVKMIRSYLCFHRIDRQQMDQYEDIDPGRMYSFDENNGELVTKKGDWGKENETEEAKGTFESEKP